MVERELTAGDFIAIERLCPLSKNKWKDLIPLPVVSDGSGALLSWNDKVFMI